MPGAPSWQFALSTPATRFALGGGRTKRTSSRRKTKRKKAAPKRRAAKRSKAKSRKSKPMRLVKGSKAAKAYMAKIRRKRAK